MSDNGDCSRAARSRIHEGLAGTATKTLHDSIIRSDGTPDADVLAARRNDPRYDRGRVGGAETVEAEWIDRAAQELAKEFLGQNVAITSENEADEILLDLGTLIAAKITRACSPTPG